MKNRSYIRLQFLNSLCTISFPLISWGRIVNGIVFYETFINVVKTGSPRNQSFWQSSSRFLSTIRADELTAELNSVRIYKICNKNFLPLLSFKKKKKSLFDQKYESYFQRSISSTAQLRYSKFLPRLNEYN